MSTTNHPPDFEVHSQYVFDIKELLELITDGLNGDQKVDTVCISIKYCPDARGNNEFRCVVEAQACIGKKLVFKVLRGCPNPPGCTIDGPG